MEKKYPFKFLDSYNQNDTDIFFGRDEEIVALYEMIFQNSMLLVYGASGTGKTSLIQCGLASKFKSYDWLALTIRRGININESLEKSLIAAGGNDIDEEEARTNDSSKQLTGLLRLIKGVYLNSFKPIYLIFDQFEELYILGTKDEQEKFIEAIKEIQKAEQPLKMIFSIREEYLGHLFEFEKQIPQLLRKKLRVEPMTLNKVTDVIKGINSSTLSNVKVKDDEIDAITQGIFERLRGKKKTLTIQLPYLQVFLDKLYIETTKDETRKSDALISLSVLNQIGDIGDVLRNFLEEQVTGISKKLSGDNRNVNPETIWKILSPFSTLEGTKEPISKKELSERLKDIDPKLINEAVESFVNSRIVNYSESSNLYELAHDSLALRIAEKRSDEEISLLEVRRLIKNQVSLKQDAKELFSKKQLNFVEPYLHKLNLTEEEDQLISESKQAIHTAEIKIKTRRRRVLIMITAITIIVIAALSYLLLQASAAKNRNKLLLANNYWNNSKSDKAENDYVYALANAAEALTLSDDSALTKKILIDIEHYWPAVILNNVIASQNEISLATYGTSDTLITVGKDFKIRKWDALTGKQISTDSLEVKTRKAVSKPVAPEILGFTDDGKKIITIDTNYTLQLSFVQNGKRVKTRPDFDSMSAMFYTKDYLRSFNYDGSRLIYLDPNSYKFRFLDLNTSQSGKSFEINWGKQKNFYGYDRISDLSLNKDGTKFLYLINDTSLFVGDIKKEVITQLLPASYQQSNQSERLVFAYPNYGSQNHMSFNHASFASDENIIITAGKDSTVRFWNVTTGNQVGIELKHKAPVQFAYLIPSTNRVFTRDAEGSTYIWDRSNSKLLGFCVKLGSADQTVQFKNDGSQLLIVENNTIFAWDLPQKNYTAKNELTTSELPNAVYSSDLTKIVIPNDSKDNFEFQLLDAKTRNKSEKKLKLKKKLNEDEISILIYGKKIFSPDNKKLLTQTSDSTMILWDLEKQTQIGDQNIPYRYTTDDDSPANRSFSIPVFSPDSKRIAALNSADYSVQFINTETGKQIGKRIFIDIPDNIPYMSWQIIFSPDSSKFLGVKFYLDPEMSEDNTDLANNNKDVEHDRQDIVWSATQLWDIMTGKPVGKENVNEMYRGENFFKASYVENFIPPFGFEGKTFVTFSSSSFQIWDAQNQKQIGENIAFKSQWPPFYSFDKKYILASVNDSTIQYFDALTAKPAGKSIRVDLNEMPLISPEGRSIIIPRKDLQNNESIQLFNSETGKPVKENPDYKHNDPDILPCFSPDGKFFLTTDRS